MNPLVILAVLVAVVGVVFVTRAVRPRPGVRRAPQPLLRPQEALDRFEARCVVERRMTLHVRFGAGPVQCLDCRTQLTTAGEGSA